MPRGWLFVALCVVVSLASACTTAMVWGINEYDAATAIKDLSYPVIMLWFSVFMIWIAKDI